jgi:hypothetical protein
MMRMEGPAVMRSDELNMPGFDRWVASARWWDMITRVCLKKRNAP